jgi:hypothetical protein
MDALAPLANEIKGLIVKSSADGKLSVEEVTKIVTAAVAKITEAVSDSEKKALLLKGVEAGLKELFPGELYEQGVSKSVRDALPALLDVAVKATALEEKAVDAVTSWCSCLPKKAVKAAADAAVDEAVAEAVKAAADFAKAAEAKAEKAAKGSWWGWLLQKKEQKPCLTSAVPVTPAVDVAAADVPKLVLASVAEPRPAAAVADAVVAAADADPVPAVAPAVAEGN